MSSLIPFQWSIKLDSGEIYMVQTNTADELGLAIEEIRTKFLNAPKAPVKTTRYIASEEEPAPKPALVCQVCGGKAEVKEGTSKAGNPYKIFRCLTNPELTDKGGHSHFMR